MMNYGRILAAVLGSAAALSFSAGPVHASDGTITFNGMVTDVTCTVQINSGAATNTVTLPTVPKSVLASAGDTAGKTAVTFQLSGCSGAGLTASTPITKAFVFFEAGPTVDTGGVAGGLPGNLINTAASGAQNVQLQLGDGTSGNAVAAGQSAQLTATTPVTIDQTAGAVTILPYWVQYYSTGGTTAGAVASTVTYSISYL